MKKLFFSLALAGVAAGSWAAYPAATPHPQFLMVIRDLERTGGDQPRPALTVIQPDGSFTTEELPVITRRFPRKQIEATIVKGTASDSTSTRLRRFRYSRNYVYQAEVRKLNELSAQGWVLVTTTHEGDATRYVMRKN